MREDVIIELSNNLKYAVLDVIEYDKEQYFLLTQLSEDEENISDELEVYKYDKIHNNFDHIEKQDIYDYVYSVFEERLKKQKLELDIINNIDFDELKSFVVVDINEYDYQLEGEDGVLVKNIEFYNKTVPMIGDKIYISSLTLEDNVLSYGHIKNVDAINHNNVLVIQRDDKRIYLQRYYG